MGVLQRLKNFQKNYLPNLFGLYSLAVVGYAIVDFIIPVSADLYISEMANKKAIQKREYYVEKLCDITLDRIDSNDNHILEYSELEDVLQFAGIDEYVYSDQRIRLHCVDYFTDHSYKRKSYVGYDGDIHIYFDIEGVKGYLNR